jgi:hypothetical protein
MVLLIGGGSTQQSISLKAVPGTYAMVYLASSFNIVKVLIGQKVSE